MASEQFDADAYHVGTGPQRLFRGAGFRVRPTTWNAPQGKAVRVRTPEPHACGLPTLLRPHQEEDTVTTALAREVLTAADRCDRCGAQAYVRVVLSSGLELLFCAHHGRAYDAKLRAMDAEITDESDRLHQRDDG